MLVVVVNILILIQMNNNQIIQKIIQQICRKNHLKLIVHHKQHLNGEIFKKVHLSTILDDNLPLPEFREDVAKSNND